MEKTVEGSWRRYEDESGTKFLRKVESLKSITNNRTEQPFTPSGLQVRRDRKTPNKGLTKHRSKHSCRQSVIIRRGHYEPKAFYPFIIRRWFNKEGQSRKREMMNKNIREKEENENENKMRDDNGNRVSHGEKLWNKRMSDEMETTISWVSYDRLVGFILKTYISRYPHPGKVKSNDPDICAESWREWLPFATRENSELHLDEGRRPYRASRSCEDLLPSPWSLSYGISQ